jgi:hypothetical protein
MAKCYNCLSISKGARDGGKGVGNQSFKEQELKRTTQLEVKRANDQKQEELRIGARRVIDQE